MAITVTPLTLITGANDPSHQVSKDVWNAGHQISLGTAKLLGRHSGGSGAAEEIGLQTGLSITGGTFTLSKIDLAAAGDCVIDHTVDPTSSSSIYALFDTANAVTAAGSGSTRGFTWLSARSAGTERIRLDWSAGSAIRWYAPGRMDFESGSNMFFSGTTFQMQAHTSFNRTGDAASTATQKDSYGFYQQMSLWTGAASSQRHCLIRAKASTSVNLAHTLKFFVNVTGGLGTEGSEVFALGYNGSAVTAGFFGVTPIIRFATTGTVNGHTGGGGTGLTHSDTFTGDTGATAYTIADVVRALKLYGLLTS